jgi:hypothetical protein
LLLARNEKIVDSVVFVDFLRSTIIGQKGIAPAVSLQDTQNPRSTPDGQKSRHKVFITGCEFEFASQIRQDT